MMYDAKEAVNASLKAASATEIGDTSYWLSSFGVLNNYNDLKIVPFDMTTGRWYSDGTNYSTDWKVRVILAF